MDQRRFDRIARLFGGATTRRAGLRAAFGAALGLAAVEPAADAGANARSRTGADGARRRVPSGGPWPAGPCGPSADDNRCKKDSQCCAGYCAGGRCRCIKRGESCTSSQTCCGGGACEDGVCPSRPSCVRPGKPCTGKDTCCRDLTCIKGACARKPVATSKACSARDTCVDPGASCIAYDSDDPAGTFCLLPTGAACSGNADCWSQDCASGVCAAVVCDVCLSGCPYADLPSALASPPANGRIKVAPGSWTGSESIQTDVRIEACGGAPGVVILPAPTNCFKINGARTLRLKNLEFSYGASQIALMAGGNSAAEMLVIDAAGCTFTAPGGEPATYFYPYSTATMTDCTFTDASIYAGTDFSNPPGDPSTFTLTRSTITMNADTYAAAFDYDIDVVFRDCTVTGGISPAGGGIGFNVAYGHSGSLTLAGSTTVTGNAATSGGGGVELKASGGGSLAFIMEDTSTITANTAPNGSGLVATLGLSGTATGTVTVTGASTRVTGNTGAPSQCAKSVDNATTWTPVPDCASF